MYKFSQRSLNNLKGVDERLVRLMKDVLSISPHDFGITEGLRTCLLYTSPSPRDRTRSRMPSSA